MLTTKNEKNRAAVKQLPRASNWKRVTAQVEIDDVNEYNLNTALGQRAPEPREEQERPQYAPQPRQYASASQVSLIRPSIFTTTTATAANRTPPRSKRITVNPTSSGKRLSTTSPRPTGTSPARRKCLFANHLPAMSPSVSPPVDRLRVTRFMKREASTKLVTTGEAPSVPPAWLPGSAADASRVGAAWTVLTATMSSKLEGASRKCRRRMWRLV